MKYYLLLTILTLNLSAQLRTDLIAHVAAGAGISGLTYHVTNKVTGKKWVSRLAGVAAGVTAGYLKEYVWDASGRGKVDKKDFLYTCYGAIGVQLFIGHKRKQK